MKNRLIDPAPTNRIARFMVALSARMNYEWALRRPGHPPFFILTEFPRSGGNWIRDQIADVLQLPAPRFSRLPTTFRAIIHNHDHRPTRHPTLYVLRDPRDVFVSHFHKIVATYLNGESSLRRKILARHPSLAPRLVKGEPGPLVPDLAFYEEWLNRSVGVRVSWPEHVSGFVGSTDDNIVIIRYEDVINDGIATLTRAATRLSGAAPDEDVVRFALTRNSFERQTDRKTGETDNMSTKRQGLAGAWRRDLPPELKERFKERMRDELRLCGYEE
jgi:hypothetical protein